MEEWRDIKGYEGLYQVSNLGNVKSLSRKIFRLGKLHRTSKDVIMSPSTTTSGYYFCMLSKDNKKVNRTIHQLVAMAFLGFVRAGLNGLVIDHIDKNKLNNNLTNLRVVNQRENMAIKNRGSSKYVGVHWCKKNKKWNSSIFINGKKKFLGSFINEDDAGIAYETELNKYNYGLLR